MECETDKTADGLTKKVRSLDLLGRSLSAV